MLERCLDDNWYREALQSRGKTDEEVKKIGTAMQEDQNESTLQQQQNVAIGRTHISGSNGQQADVTLSQPPSIPTCRKF